MEIEAIARGFALKARTVDRMTVLARDGVEVRFAELFELASLEGRNRALCACLGARLGIDRLVHEHEVAGEMERNEAPRNIYEHSSPYGERILRLLPKAALDVAATVGGFEPVTDDWVPGTPFRLAFLLAVGRQIHVLGGEDLPHVAGGRKTMVENARRVLFYEVYGLRPSRTEAESGAKVSWFEAAGGLGSSVASLFPDFDLDTARDHGAFLIPGYDRLVVWRPTTAPTTAGLRALARAEIRDVALPFSRRTYYLRPGGVILGETCDARPEFDPSDLVHNLIETAV